MNIRPKASNWGTIRAIVLDMKILIAILALSTAAIACGVPQSVTGRVLNPLFMRSIVTLEVADDPEIAIWTSTNSFGYFRFPSVTPCNDYRLRVKAKWFTYPETVFTLPGDSGVEIIVEPIK